MALKGDLRLGPNAPGEVKPDISGCIGNECERPIATEDGGGHQGFETIGNPDHLLYNGSRIGGRIGDGRPLLAAAGQRLDFLGMEDKLRYDDDLSFAEAWLREALNEDPENLKYLEKLSDVLGREGRFGEAYQVGQEYLRLARGGGLNPYWLAAFEKGLERLMAKKVRFEPIRQLIDRQSDVPDQNGFIYLTHENIDAFLARFNGRAAVFVGDPTSEDAAFFRARFALDQNDALSEEERFDVRVWVPVTEDFRQEYVLGVLRLHYSYYGDPIHAGDGATPGAVAAYRIERGRPESPDFVHTYDFAFRGAIPVRNGNDFRRLTGDYRVHLVLIGSDWDKAGTTAVRSALRRASNPYSGKIGVKGDEFGWYAAEDRDSRDITEKGEADVVYVDYPDADRVISDSSLREHVRSQRGPVLISFKNGEWWPFSASQFGVDPENATFSEDVRAAAIRDTQRVETESAMDRANLEGAIRMLEDADTPQSLYRARARAGAVRLKILGEEAISVLYDSLAIEFFERAVTVDPSYLPARLALAEELFAYGGRCGEVRDLFEPMGNIPADSAGARFWKARALHERGEISEARALYGECLSLEESARRSGEVKTDLSLRGFGIFEMARLELAALEREQGKEYALRIGEKIAGGDMRGAVELLRECQSLRFPLPEGEGFDEFVSRISLAYSAKIKKEIESGNLKGAVGYLNESQAIQIPLPKGESIDEWKERIGAGYDDQIGKRLAAGDIDGAIELLDEANGLSIPLPTGGEGLRFAVSQRLADENRYQWDDTGFRYIPASEAFDERLRDMAGSFYLGVGHPVTDEAVSFRERVACLEAFYNAGSQLNLRDNNYWIISRTPGEGSHLYEPLGITGPGFYKVTREREGWRVEAARIPETYMVRMGPEYDTMVTGTDMTTLVIHGVWGGDSVEAEEGRELKYYLERRMAGSRSGEEPEVERLKIGGRNVERLVLSVIKESEVPRIELCSGKGLKRICANLSAEDIPGFQYSMTVRLKRSQKEAGEYLKGDDKGFEKAVRFVERRVSAIIKSGPRGDWLEQKNAHELWIATRLAIDGRKALEQGKRDRARKLFQRAIDLNPRYLTPNVELARLLYNDGNWGQKDAEDARYALGCYSSDVYIGPQEDKARALFYLGMAHRRLRDNDEAARALRLFLSRAEGIEFEEKAQMIAIAQDILK